MREQLPLEDEEVKKAIKEAAESLPDENESGEEIPKGMPYVSDKELMEAHRKARENEERRP